jgi:protein kinase/serine/threonine-protein kinase
LAGDWKGARDIYTNELGHYSASPSAKEAAAFVELFARQFDSAARYYTELASGDPLGGGKDMSLGMVDYRSALARIKIAGGEEPQAAELLRACIVSQQSRLSFAPNDVVALYQTAAAKAMLGEKESSLQHLQAAIHSGWTDFRATQLDPRFDGIRAEPAFKKAISELANRVAGLRAGITNRKELVNSK